MLKPVLIGAGTELRTVFNTSGTCDALCKYDTTGWSHNVFCISASQKGGGFAVRDSAHLYTFCRPFMHARTVTSRYALSLPYPTRRHGEMDVSLLLLYHIQHWVIDISIDDQRRWHQLLHTGIDIVYSWSGLPSLPLCGFTLMSASTYSGLLRFKIPDAQFATC